MKLINITTSIITFLMFTLNTNAEPIKTKKQEPAPQVIQIAPTNVRSTIKINNNGSAYKYEYILDNTGRVVNKLTSLWNTTKQEWSPVSAYSVVYTNAETVLSYAMYDEASKTYSKDTKQKRYSAEKYPVLIKIPECCK